MKRLLSLLFALIQITLHAQIWEEDFNGITSLPSGWSQSTQASDGGWLISTASNLSSSNFLIPPADSSVICTNDDNCNCNKSNDLLYLPLFDPDTLAGAFFAFDLYYLAQSYAGASESLKLEISFDGGSDWDLVAELPATDGWETFAFDLAPYADSASLRFGLRYADGGGWLYGAAVDNIRMVDVSADVVDASLSQASLGVSVTAIPAVIEGFDKYLSGEEVFPVVYVTNESFTPIHSFDISYTHNSNTTTETINSLNIAAGESYQYIFNDGAVINAGVNDFYFALSNVNEGAETTTSNNTDTTVLEGINPVALKRVVLEEATGTGCGWCPAGIVMRDYLLTKYPQQFVALAVHHDDPMEVADYDDALGLNTSTWPSGLIDRAVYNDQLGLDPLDYEKALINRIATDPGVTVATEIELYSSTSANVVSQLNFSQDLAGIYKIAVVLFENEVSGSDDAWDQVNFYAGDEYGPMGGFELLADTIPASEITYDHVARALIGGWNGISNSVPSNPTAGLAHTYATAITLDPQWDLDNLYAVTLLIGPDGEIVNTGLSSAIATGIDEHSNNAGGLQVFPNPAQDMAYIRIGEQQRTDLIVHITDTAGRELSSREYFQVNAANVIPLNTGELANGLYTITIQTPATVISRTLIVSHH